MFEPTVATFGTGYKETQVWPKYESGRNQASNYHPWRNQGWDIQAGLVRGHPRCSGDY